MAKLRLYAIENVVYDAGSVKDVQLRKIVESAYTAGGLFFADLPCTKNGKLLGKNKLIKTTLVVVSVVVSNSFRI